MINWLETFINGIIAGLGMTIVMTVFGFLTFRLAKAWITKIVSDIWARVREEGLRLDGIQIAGTLETKRTKDKK
jgi:hypothetical protein